MSLPLVRSTGQTIQITGQLDVPSTMVVTGATTLNGTFTVNANTTFTQPVSTSGTPEAFHITGGAHTTLTLAECMDVEFALARTVQFNGTGAFATQRAMLVSAPTYAFSSAGGGTITNAITLAISGAPVAGVNAILTNSYALAIQSGASIFNGEVRMKPHSAFAGSEQKIVSFGVQTTNATITSLAIITLTDTFTYVFKVTVTARDAAGVEHAGYYRLATFFRDGGSATQVSTTTAAFTHESNAAMDCIIDASGNNVRVRVTGLASTNINWVAYIEYHGVSGNT